MCLVEASNGRARISGQTAPHAGDHELILSRDDIELGLGGYPACDLERVAMFFNRLELNKALRDLAGKDKEPPKAVAKKIGATLSVLGAGGGKFVESYGDLVG